jgi:hypothetical protein
LKQINATWEKSRTTSSPKYDLKQRKREKEVHSFNPTKCDLNYVKAWIIYEDEIADSKEQYDCIRMIIGALQMTQRLVRCHLFQKKTNEIIEIFFEFSLPEQQYADLIKKTAQYSAKLLRKPDQSNAIAMCSHLFWVKPNNTVQFFLEFLLSLLCWSYFGS